MLAFSEHLFLKKVWLLNEYPYVNILLNSLGIDVEVLGGIVNDPLFKHCSRVFIMPGLMCH